MASFSFSDFDDDEIGDREEYMRSKSERHQRSSRYRRSLSRKSSESASYIAREVSLSTIVAQ